MAKYIKQELPDLHKTGEKKAYYRLKTERKIDFNQFIDRISSHNSGISRGEAIHVLVHATDILAELLADGYAVTIDDMGTFKNVDGEILPKEVVDKIDICIDLICNPKMTKFLQYSKKGYNGNYMLIYQALHAEILWGNVGELDVLDLYEKL